MSLLSACSFRSVRRAFSSFVFFVLAGALVCVAFFSPASAQTSAAVSLVPSRVVAAVDSKDMALLKGNVHPLARAEFDRGAAPASLRLDRMMLMLKRSDDQEKILRKLIDDQQDKNSPSFHKWMTPQEFGKAFGPSDADVAAVTSWLKSQGFEGIVVGNGRTFVEFSGDAARLKQAFHTEMHQFSVKGQTHYANASEPQIPRALTPVVSGFLSLHNFRKAPQLRVLPQRFTANYVPGSRPQLTTSTGLHAMGPADFETIYNAGIGGITGGSVSIAVVGRSNINQNDLSDFRSVFGIGGTVPDVLVVGPDPGDLGGGEEDEAVLDMSWSGAIAPGANTTLVVSASTEISDGVDLSEFYIVDNNLAAIMTESFGTCEAGASTSQALSTSANAEQAAAQGISFFVSTGDTGAAGCDNLSEAVATGPVSVNLLASTPFNTAVGGTLFNENGQDSKYWTSTNDSGTLGSALSYIPEDVWNESCTSAQCGAGANIAAGGGGASVFFTKPAWQSGVAGIPSDGVRDIPDISLSAAGHDPYLICITGSCVPNAQGQISFAGISGTSASTPSFAGIMALVVQKQGGQRQGLANYTLYKLAAAETLSGCNGSSTTTAPGSTCVFNDTTVGNNTVPGQSPSTGFYNARTGYDLATGLGSVNVTNLVNQWSSVTYTPTTTTLSVNGGTAVNVVHGTAVPFTVTVAPQTGSGTPTGDFSLISKDNIFSNGLDGNTLSGGSFTGNTASLPGGTTNITAHYAGDTTFGASDSTPVSVTVTPESSVTNLILYTADANGNLFPFTSGPTGTLVYFHVDVAGLSGAGSPTGTINVLDSGSLFFSEPLNSDGKFIVGTTSLIVGSHSLTAAYSGDASFSTGTSVAVAAAITDFTFTASPTTFTISAGQTASSTLTIAALGGFTGTVNFTVTGCPTLSTCAAAAVTTAGTSMLTIKTTGPSASLAPNSNPNGIYLAWTGGFGLAGMFLLGIGQRRRKLMWLLGATVLLGMLLILPACGGSSGGGGGGSTRTPAGAYPITVTATSGATSHTANITVNVN